MGRALNDVTILYQTAALLRRLACLMKKPSQKRWFPHFTLSYNYADARENKKGAVSSLFTVYVATTKSKPQAIMIDGITNLFRVKAYIQVRFLSGVFFTIKSTSPY